ncbi:polyprenyl synthetase family protein [Sphingomonas arenae]|uniref:polyprenyl synthetase family protein n=1 Tax=Sphingomonas arenae TaxID=2812555 RepID=UPI0019675AF2|nr:polyprenyl synthetase family protein [Sphingomonas arenae]
MASVRNKESAARTDDSAHLFFDTLDAYRSVVLRRLRELVPQGGRYRHTLYGPMLDYPLREGKGFRPALCLALCQACGGSLAHALDTAVALEMFHNAFLIHDDIEDASETRRGEPTLHARHGIAAATNIGDALNMLALQTLLANTGLIGLERALVVIQIVSRMARESTEGQSMELDWVRNGDGGNLGLRDYLLMCFKKTTWYTCISPMQLGAVIADVPDHRLASLVPFGFRVGAAFQIQDDILNLVGEEHLYGKETNGDIAEGKRTLMVLHAMACSPAPVRERLRAIYAKPRHHKSVQDLRDVLDAMHVAGSIDYSRAIAHRLSASARRHFDRRLHWIPPGPHRQFIEAMIDYMCSRHF